MSKNDRHDEDTSVSVIDYTLEVFDLSQTQHTTDPKMCNRGLPPPLFLCLTL